MNDCKSEDIDTVVNACDAGREGDQSSATHINMQSATSSLSACGFLRWKTQQSSKAGKFKSLILPPADAARCRSEADWLVGLNATRAMTCLARSGGGDQLLSVGRVQTPTLALIVEREKQIAAFNPETFWKIQATFKMDDSDIQWVGTFFQNSLANRSSADSNDKKKDQSLAERLFEQSDADHIRIGFKQNGYRQQSHSKEKY